MARQPRKRLEAVLRADPICPIEKQINVLLMGQTGVGKTTFINALANYFINDSLQQAAQDNLQVIIPSSFSFTVPDSYEERTIAFGERDSNENPNSEVHSATQQCRSYVFPIGDRSLRLIDTPGIGDTRGIEQDEKNFGEILSYIAQYQHLNAVCVLLKPNEERLAILFRFCINELLRHLHTSAAENLIFVLTNARTTFYAPGNTKKLLQTLLDQHQNQHNVAVPFSMSNTFLFDNEPFRYLAIRKQGIQLDEDQTQSYARSWDRSVKEYSRMMRYIVTRPLHAVANTLSLNEAEQLVRKLPRPMAETANLIQQNLQLAQDHKKRVLENPEIAEQGIPQNDGTVVRLTQPRTVCVSKRCCQVIEVNGERKVDYISKCHEDCYLKGVEQEKIADEKLEDCTAMNPYTGFCNHCHCHWSGHMHITYEYRMNRIHLKSKTTVISLADIDRRISDLRREAAEIQNVYKQIAAFLHANSILPVNDAIIEYLKYFIREARMKQNADVVAGLERMMAEVAANIELLKKTIQQQKESAEAARVIEPSEIFTLVETLYDLPITGRQIREQVEGIQFTQQRQKSKHERFVELPRKAASSQVMRESIEILKNR